MQCVGELSMREVYVDVTMHVSMSYYFRVLPLQAAEVLSNSTSQPEVLQADAVSETAEVIETVLTDAAIADPMV